MWPQGNAWDAIGRKHCTKDPSPAMPPESPQPLRRRSRTPVAASPSPWRARVLQYGLAFVTIVLVVDALVGDKGFLDTLRARRQYREVVAALAHKRQDNTRLREE